MRDQLDIDQRRTYLDAAQSFADLCRTVIRDATSSGLDVNNKPDKTVVTSADIAAEKAFREAVAEWFPEMGVIGEELAPANPDSDWQWVIDPIDGTAEFVGGLPTWGSIIGLYFGGQPVVGVIDHPALDRRYHAAYGLGAFCGDERMSIADIEAGSIDGSERMAIAARENFLRYADEGAIFDALVDAHPNLRVFHSCFAHSSALLGAVDVMVEWNVRPWDIAASQLLIEEAGGAYSEVRASEERGVGMVHSAVFGRPRLVAEILEQVSQVRG